MKKTMSASFVFLMHHPRIRSTDIAIKATLYTNNRAETLQITDGNLGFVDVHELWGGITVEVQEEDSLIIGTYVPEEHTIFTLQHLEACVPLFVLIILIVMGILAVCAVRKRKA